MHQTNATPLFPAPISFPDIDPATLALEEANDRLAHAALEGAWADYLRKFLPILSARQNSLHPV